MQQNRPCCWNPHTKATILGVTSTKAGEENVLKQLAAQRPMTPVLSLRFESFFFITLPIYETDFMQAADAV
jgi:hypothetical protein